jgi:hypothetical protein
MTMLSKHHSIKRDQLEMITLDQLVPACKIEIKKGYREYKYPFVRFVHFYQSVPKVKTIKK